MTRSSFWASAKGLAGREPVAIIHFSKLSVIVSPFVFTARDVSLENVAAPSIRVMLRFLSS